MTYKFNGVDLTLQPTEANWQPRKELGIDGNGHPVYEGPRQCQLKWDLIPVTDFNQLNNAYRGQGTTGTVIVDLPHWSGSSWEFVSYTGCVISEPTVGAYFQTAVQKVVLVVSHVVD